MTDVLLALLVVVCTVLAVGLFLVAWRVRQLVDEARLVAEEVLTARRVVAEAVRDLKGHARAVAALGPIGGLLKEITHDG